MLNKNKTRVTVNTKYVVSKKVVAKDVLGKVMRSFSGHAGFNYGRRGVISGNPVEPKISCVATGKLEQKILSVIR